MSLNKSEISKKLKDRGISKYQYLHAMNCVDKLNSKMDSSHFNQKGITKCKYLSDAFQDILKNSGYNVEHFEDIVCRKDGFFDKAICSVVKDYYLISRE
jgi:hypothetical protein